MTEVDHSARKPDMNSMREAIPTVESITAFATENRVSVDNSSAACGDGRYTPEQSHGAVRIFGGDLGVLMAVRATFNKAGIKMQTSELYGRYKEAIKKFKGEDAKVDYHSDDHHKEIDEVGCGHAGLSSNPANEGLYKNLHVTDVQELYREVVNDPEANRVELVGSHNEKSVIIVDTPDNIMEPVYSVNSQNPQTGEMHFVVDKAGAVRYIRNVVTSLGIEGLSVEDSTAHLMQHTGVTAGFLAKDFEQFQVVFDGETPIVTSLGKVHGTENK